MAVYSIEEFVASFSKELPEWQQEENLRWAQSVHQRLREGGVLASPGLGKSYIKTKEGFEELTLH